MTRFQFNDGGRRDAGYDGRTGDCVTRALAIATGLPYQKVYDDLSAGCRSERRSKHKNRKRLESARNGVRTSRKWFNDYITSLGFRWVPTMAIGQGCKVHLRADELPAGRLVVNVSKHLTAVIDGVINDTYNPDRGGTRCVYGYWKFEGQVYSGPAPKAIDRFADLARRKTRRPKPQPDVDEHAEALNAHMDYDHGSDPKPDCSICKEYGWV